VVNGEISFMTHDLSKLAVLVVDDNGNMRKVVRTLLATMGIKGVMEAESATGAILEMHEHDIDVVIIDLSIQPMNGIDLVSMVHMGRDSPKPPCPDHYADRAPGTGAGTRGAGRGNRRIRPQAGLGAEPL